VKFRGETKSIDTSDRRMNHIWGTGEEKSHKVNWREKIGEGHKVKQREEIGKGYTIRL
jgi:hypothetical protein